MEKMHRFQFGKGVTDEFLNKQMEEIVADAESLNGYSRVRLGVSYFIKSRKAVIVTRSKVGEQILLVFTGRMARKVGRGKFTFKSE